MPFVFPGEMVAVHVSLDDSNESEVENLSISQLNEFLCGQTDKETADKLDQLLDGLPPLVAVRKHNSVLLYFYCVSASEMYKLSHLLESGQLKVILEEVFGTLSGTSSVLNVSVRLNDEEQFTDCYRQLLEEGQLNDFQYCSFVWFIGQLRITTLFIFCY